MSDYGPRMGLLDRLKGTPHDDEASITSLLVDAGATPDEAQELVALLGQRISPSDMRVWLTHPENCHPVPDPTTVETFGVELVWTPINAVPAGKTDLVIAEARRFVSARAPTPAAPPRHPTPAVRPPPCA